MASSQNKRVLALMRLPENSLCADCRAKDPRWASSKLGVFICINCSGIHRGLGTHITFVRSCTLDTWKPEEVDVMERVGNKKGNEYWEARLPPDFVRPRSEDVEAMSKFIRQKYEYKKWIDPLMRPPQIPENIPWEPDPPKTNSDMFSDQNNQMPNEPPRRRKKKKVVDNQNMPDEPFNNNMDFQNQAPYGEFQNKMINNTKKYPQNNISLGHENDGPSSESLINTNQKYNPNNRNNHNYSTDDDNGYDTFSGKPLSKERDYNPDEDTDESDPTFADKLMGFIQNGIDFIKEKTKSKKRSNIPSSSGRMSENPRIPQHDQIDALQPHNLNRPHFNSFEQQEQQIHHQPPPQQQQQPQPQFNHQPPPQPPQYQQHSDIGMDTRRQNQQQQSNDVFSLLSGSEVIIDDSQTVTTSSQSFTEPSQKVGQQQPQKPPPNPFLNEMSSGQNQGQFNSGERLIGSSDAENKKDGFNPFIQQPAGSSSEKQSVDLLSVDSNEKKSESSDLIGIDFTSHVSQNSAAQPTTTNSDNLLSLDLNAQSQQNLQQSQGYASDLFGLDVTSTADSQIQSQQNGSNGPTQQAPSNPQIRTSAYDVFGRPGSVGVGVGVGSFGAQQPGLGSLGLTPQQQQIAARAVLASHGSQRGSAQLAAYGSASSGFGQTGSNGSFTNFNMTPSSQLGQQNMRANKSGSGNLGHSNDPFSGMNPF